MKEDKTHRELKPISFWVFFTILLSSYIDAITEMYNVIEANILSILLVHLCYYHFAVCHGRWR